MKNTIVIVDDTRFFQETLQNSVEKFGFNAMLCDDGLQAIKCLEKHNASVAAVFLDIYMPQVDGISVLGHFRSNYPNLPVFIMTSSEDGSDKRSAEGLGAAAYIKKPFTVESIDEIIKTIAA